MKRTKSLIKGLLMNIYTIDKIKCQDLLPEGGFPIWNKKYLRKQKRV
jgi:hypothetical protein